MVFAADGIPGPARGRSHTGGRWLARYAPALVGLLRDRPPARWDRPAFRGQVERIRGDLAPIRSRRALGASFSREGALIARAGRPSLALEGPLVVAYAIRWLELGRDGP